MRNYLYLIKWCIPPLVVCTFFFLLPSLTNCRGISYIIISQSQLKTIMTQWVIHLYENDPRPVEVASIKNALPTQLNPRAHRLQVANQFRWNESMQQTGVWLLVLFSYILFVLIILKMNGKKVYTSFYVLCTVFIFSSIILTQFSRFNKVFWPGDKSYIDDFVYMNNLSIPVCNQMPSATIVAYSKYTINHHRRVVGFSDGHATRMNEQEFQRIIREQGIFKDYPEDIDLWQDSN